MAEFKNPIDQFIKKLGGTVVVATALNVSPSVVSTWRIVGSIPNWRAPLLQQLAKDAGVPIPRVMTKPRKAPRKRARRGIAA